VSLSFLKRFGNGVARRFEKKNALHIALCEERLCFPGGREITLEKSEALASWRPALDALARILPQHRGDTAGLVLADQFVRYALLPWSETLKTHEQWLAFARHRFTSIHGPVANDWEIKFAGTAPGGPRLACAVDRELIDELVEQFSANAVRLVSVQPFLVAAFNQVKDGVMSGGGSCWLVVEEPGRLTLALFLRGVWVAIRSRRADEHWRRVLPEILDRETAFLGLEDPCTRVVVCAQGPFDAFEHESFRTDALSYRELALHDAHDLAMHGGPS
jgi:hypothetical protein